MESKVCPFTIAAFLKFHNDQIILSVCQDIFKALSQNPDCIELLHNRLVPTLVSMMSINHADKSKDGKLINFNFIEIFYNIHFCLFCIKLVGKKF